MRSFGAEAISSNECTGAYNGKTLVETPRFGNYRQFAGTHLPTSKCVIGSAPISTYDIAVRVLYREADLLMSLDIRTALPRLRRARSGSSSDFARLCDEANAR